VADRVFRRPAVRRAPRRLSQWVASADQGYLAVASAASGILQSNASLGNTTIVRTRGLLSVRPTAFSADLDVSGAFGIAIVSDQAFAAGAASVPGPFTDQDWDGWFVWMPMLYRYEFGDLTGQALISKELVIDSKAMRKVGANETVVVVFEAQAGAVSVASHFRMLVKLS